MSSEHDADRQTINPLRRLLGDTTMVSVQIVDEEAPLQGGLFLDEMMA